MITLDLVQVSFCPACGNGSSRKQLLNLEKFRVFECACSHRFIDPALSGRSQMEIYRCPETLKELNPAMAGYYEYNTLAPKSVTFRDYQKTLVELERLSQGRALLEIGCGTGSFMKAAKHRGWDVFGVDSNPDNIRKINEEGLAASCNSFLELYTEKSFDVLAMWDLIEHPLKPSEFIRKAHEVLNPGGLLFLALPYYPNLLSLLAEFFYYASGGHIRGPAKRLFMLEHTSYFNRKSLNRLLEGGGFDFVHSWKAETDLNRYRFSLPMRVCLRSAFSLARMIGLQNRINVIARKN